MKNQRSISGEERVYHRPIAGNYDVIITLRMLCNEHPTDSLFCPISFEGSTVQWNLRIMDTLGTNILSIV